ncbi:hypothetical protein O3G_MSEX000613 [Manduca sexta]|nr:hypothetical protein O3G_MSEX000613 [Manduca sexta]
MNGNALEVVDRVKYLGMWLDCNLRWGTHIDYIVQKCSGFLNPLKVLAGSSWGMHPAHLRRLYIALVRSRMDYACFLYGNSSITYLRKLDKIQNQSLRIIGGFIRTTPIHVMEGELAIPPLNIRRRYLCSKFWLKTKSIVPNCMSDVLGNLVQKCNNNLWRRKSKPLLVEIYNNLVDLNIHLSPHLEMFSLSTWVGYININKIIKLNINSLDKSKHEYDSGFLKHCFARLCREFYDGFYSIYTDGSKGDSKTGAAIYDQYLNCGIQFQINHNISIMHTELLAIAEALSYIDSVDYDKFVIFTDSKSALQHLARCTSTIRGIPIAYTILRLIWNCQNKKKEIFLQWIPSHCGIGGNERVDQLAKYACSEGICLPTKPCFIDYIPFIKKTCFKLWKEYFDSRSREVGIWYKTIQPEPLSISWISNCSLNRTDAVLIMRLRSGHVPLNKFAFLMGKVLSPLCSECDKIEDVYHIIMECLRNEEMRIQYWDLLEGVGGCNSILAFPLSCNAKMLLKLVKMALRRRC